MESRKRDAVGSTEDEESSAKKSKKAADFREYYGQIKNQQNMLQDYVRTGSYFNAVMQNAQDFQGKVVLDVGTGSGILAFFAARAGARRVYAVEGSNVARQARKLLAANHFGNVVHVVQEQLGRVELPEQVDIIISEPLGVLLVHERMLETYIQARARWLKPGGRMFPSTATVHVAPFTDRVLHEEQTQRAEFWRTPNFFGMDLSSLYPEARLEHFSQPVVGIFDPDILMSRQTAQWSVDFASAQEQDLHHISLPFRLLIANTELVHGLACWFDVEFIGSVCTVPMSTSPHAPPTHWQQCRLMLEHPIAANAGQFVCGVLDMRVNDHYSYDLKLTMELEGTSVGSTCTYELQNQLYRYLPTTPLQLQQQQDFINCSTPGPLLPPHANAHPNLHPNTQPIPSTSTSTNQNSASPASDNPQNPYL